MEEEDEGGGGFLLKMEFEIIKLGTYYKSDPKHQ